MLAECIFAAEWADWVFLGGITFTMIQIAWRHDISLWRAFKMMSGWDRLPLNKAEWASIAVTFAAAGLLLYIETKTCLAA